MKLSSEQCENIKFRKKTLHDKLEQLEQMISGRDADITPYRKTKKGKYTETSVHHFLKEMMTALDDYIRAWEPDAENQIPQKWKECAECFLYCVIRVMDSNLTWMEQWTSHFPKTTFDQILEFSKDLDMGNKRYYVLFAELYYGKYEQMYDELDVKDFFWYCDWMYEELTGKEITDTISDALRKKVAHVYASEIEEKNRLDMVEDEIEEKNKMDMLEDEINQEPEEEISDDLCSDLIFESLSEEEQKQIEKDIEEAESYDKELQNRLEQWKKDFQNPEIFCERYLMFRELYFEGTLDMCGNFATLIEGMLDTYLYRKGLPGYADEDFFITAFTHLRKMTNQIAKRKEEE